MPVSPDPVWHPATPGRATNPMTQILDSLPQAIFWKGLDGAYLGCNQAFAHSAGLDDPERIVGLTDFDLPWGREASEAYRLDDREVMDENRPKRDILEPLQQADGTRLWIRTTKVPLRDPEGRVCGVLGNFEDVTERKRVEEALAASENRLRFAFEGANDGLWDVQMQTGAVYLSPRACEILGYGKEELPHLAQVWHQLVHPEDLPHTQEALEAHLAGRAPIFQVEQRLRTKTGGWIWVLARGKVVERDAAGAPLRMTGTHTDISQRKADDAERRELTAQLHQSQKLESLGSLAGGVAHDLNNVLAAILSLAAAHQGQVDPGAPLGRALATITQACLRGRDVVRSLLYFARKDLEAFGPVDLNAIIMEMVQLLENTTLKRVRISTELQEPLPHLTGDAGALSHSLMNLCVNALDAMPGGGTLRLRTRQLADGRLEMSVQDSGEGMTAEVLKQAVEPFFTTKPVGKGTGLGLAMVYGTVQAHGGTLAMTSDPGFGTEVTLTFPCGAQGPGSGAAEAPEAAPAAAPLRILLVDDDELIRAAFVPMLGLLGHEVQAAADGLEALERLEEGLAVDLVILDMNMPGLNGAETLPRILALRPGQCVLMATGYSDGPLTPLVQALPNVAYLPKPFTLREFQESLTLLPLARGR